MRLGWDLPVAATMVGGSLALVRVLVTALETMADHP